MITVLISNLIQSTKNQKIIDCSIDIKLNLIYNRIIESEVINLKQFQISLAAARVNAGLTQDDVAKAVKVGKQTIVSWEKGNSEPKMSQCRQLSELYKMPLDYIFLPTKSN